MFRTLPGKVCLVTGATGGLGKATALDLARQGATVVIVGRNQARIAATVAEIRSVTGNECIHGLRADLSVREEVGRVAKEFQRLYDRLDVLVNNVGGTFLSYLSTADGFEQSWALNYLLHFYLTQLLMNRLVDTAEQAGEARVIELTSSIYRFSSRNFHQRQTESRFNGVEAYAQSKRALIVWTCEQARRLNGCGVAINAITPGFVATNVARKNTWWSEPAMRLIRRFSKPVGEGIKPIVHLAASPKLRGVTGQYFYQYRRRQIHPADASPEAGQALWSLSEKMLDYRLA